MPKKRTGLADMTDLKSSFRDPSGPLFTKEGVLHRRISNIYKKHWEHAERSGLHQELIREKLLIPHADLGPGGAVDAYRIIRPTRIPFISYPYEWCFSQLKDAALLTLEVQKRALRHEMILKDASAFNVQFLDGRPIFIDTLSFEMYEEGSPWIGYRQFCQHFLAPLALMSRTDIRLNRLFQIFLDGIPLDLASSLLPWSTWFSPLLLSHIHLHAKSQKRFESEKSAPVYKIPRHNLLALVDSLETAVKNLSLRKQDTEWGNYYQETNYSADAFRSKTEIVTEFLRTAGPKTVWDIGANTGEFSRLASEAGIRTIAFDIDPIAVEKYYRVVKRGKEKNVLPLLVDFTNPSPAIGWENDERTSLVERGPVDAIMALALVHHLAISNNVPLKRVAEFFSRSCKNLIVEFIPKTDSQVQKLLATREDVFPDYSEQGFENAFATYFIISGKKSVSDSKRTLYHMTKR